jgi:RNA polymerase sigma-70 factor, ECF subfamily
MSSVLAHGSRAVGRERAAPVEWDTAALERELEAKRGALIYHCARLLGSQADAEDAVQETMMRAWLGLGRFQGRASLQSWLYTIATSVCFTMLRRGSRRPRPVDVDALGTTSAAPSVRSFEHPWVLALAPTTFGGHDDPAEHAVAREDVQRAVAVALGRLPPRQRAVLFLRDVCSWKAKEVAELLESSVASVNSALQRARASLRAGTAVASVPTAITAPRTSLLACYVDALERADVSRLVTLVHQDACGERRTLGSKRPAVRAR